MADNNCSDERAFDAGKSVTRAVQFPSFL